MLAILAAAGYHYTARQLAIRLILTAYVLVGGIVCRALLLRWTLVNQRKLAIEQARQRRAAAQNEGNSGEETAAELPASAVAGTRPGHDQHPDPPPGRILAGRGLRAGRLVCVGRRAAGPEQRQRERSGQTTVTVTESRKTVPSGGTKIVDFRRPMIRDITLADLCLAAIVLATTVIAAKNIPGLLEMAVLQHLPFDAGARYAVATVCRYVITIVGLLFCCGSRGRGLVEGPMARGRDGLGIGLRFAGNLRQFHLRPDHPLRAAGARRRRGHDRQASPAWSRGFA